MTAKEKQNLIRPYVDNLLINIDPELKCTIRLLDNGCAADFENIKRSFGILKLKVELTLAISTHNKKFTVETLGFLYTQGKHLQNQGCQILYNHYKEDHKTWRDWQWKYDEFDEFGSSETTPLPHTIIDEKLLDYSTPQQTLAFLQEYFEAEFFVSNTTESFWEMTSVKTYGSLKIQLQARHPINTQKNTWYIAILFQEKPLTYGYNEGEWAIFEIEKKTGQYHLYFKEYAWEEDT